MIDIIMIIIIFICLIISFIIKYPKEISIIVNGLLLSSLFYYLGFNIGNVFLSKVFMILTFLSILMILVLEILSYLDKL